MTNYTIARLWNTKPVRAKLIDGERYPLTSEEANDINRVEIALNDARVKTNNNLKKCFDFLEEKLINEEMLPSEIDELIVDIEVEIGRFYIELQNWSVLLREDE